MIFLRPFSGQVHKLDLLDILKAYGKTYYAVLRTTGAALRLAMKAARRAPRAQGITVSFLAAVSTTDLMKRVLVFMVRILRYVGICPLIALEYAKTFWRRLGEEDFLFKKVRTGQIDL